MARTAGAKNKVPLTVKNEIMAVYEMCDGRHGMHRWAMANPDAFYRMYGSMAPKEIIADVEADVSIQLVSYLDHSTDTAD